MACVGGCAVGLTERQALALALAESRRAALAAQPPPQVSPACALCLDCLHQCPLSYSGNLAKWNTSVCCLLSLRGKRGREEVLNMRALTCHKWTAASIFKGDGGVTLSLCSLLRVAHILRLAGQRQ